MKLVIDENAVSVLRSRTKSFSFAEVSVHPRLIWLVDEPVAQRPVGALGTASRPIKRFRMFTVVRCSRESTTPALSSAHAHEIVPAPNTQAPLAV